MSYYHTVSPCLTTPKIVDAFFLALSTVSVTEAFHFAREHDTGTHRRLLDHLVSHVLSSSDGEQRALRGIELVNLPFSEEEEEWFEDCLTAGKCRSSHGAKDTLMMRRMAMGRFAAALEDPKAPIGRKVDGINWTVLKDALKNGTGPRNLASWSSGSL